MASGSDELASPLLRVESLDDPRLGDYRSVREADLVGRRGAFIAEGEVVLGVLVAQPRYRTRSVLLAEGRLAKLRPLLARLGPDTPIYVAPGALMDELVGFRIHRGVLAVGERTAPPDPAALLARLGPGPRLVVALEALTNHDNVGGVFRNAMAFGADAVLLDDRACDPLYRKSIRVSAGGALRVPFARFGSAAAMLAGLGQAGFSVVALSPRPGATAIAHLAGDAALPARVALLLGTEGPGLSSASLDAADVVARIPIEPDVDSLNVAVAAGIALYAIRRAQAEAARSGCP